MPRRRDESSGWLPVPDTASADSVGIRFEGGARYGLGHPVVLILLAAGFVDLLTGDPMGGALLAAVGAGLAWSRGRRDEEVDSGPEGEQFEGAGGSRVRACAIAAGLLGYALLAGIPPRFSWLGTLAVVVPGAAVVTLARHPAGCPKAFAPVQTAGAAAWVVVLIGLCAWELVNLLLQPSLTVGSYDHPTLSALAEPFLSGHAGRSVGMAIWLGAGWYLLERR